MNKFFKILFSIFFVLLFETSTAYSEETKIKIGVLGSTSGTSLQLLLDTIKAEKINASIEVIVSNKKDAYILTRGKIHNINNIYLSNKNISNFS